MKRYLKLYQIFIKYSLTQAMMYKQDFLIWTAVMTGWFVVTLVFYQILYLNVQEIAGWSKPEMLVLQGFFFILNFVLWGILWPNMRQIPKKINTGELDLELTKPINTQFLLSFKFLDLDNFHETILGTITIVYALRLLNIFPTIEQIAFSVLFLIIASIYVYAGYFITICIAFWFDRVDNLHFLFPSVRQLWKQPHSFYKGIFKLVLTLIVPVTLVTTVPTHFLLNKPTGYLTVILIIFAVISLKFSSWFFKIAIKRYSSASS